VPRLFFRGFLLAKRRDRVQQTTKTVLCAAGDGNAYEWNLESLTATAAAAAWGGAPGDAEEVSPVRTYGGGGKGYLHAVAVRTAVGLVFLEDCQVLPSNSVNAKAYFGGCYYS